MIVDQGEEMLMDGGVVSQFRMESCGEYVVFLDQCGFAGEFGEDFYAWTDAVDDRGADEHHLHRLRFKFGVARGNFAG